jgi:glycosyltransferase involved in cell wall biosynthesis
LNNITIVAVSKWLEGIVQESYLAKYPINVIHNGIDTNAFYPLSNCSEIKRKYGIVKDFMLMGVATAWGSRKGLDDYIRLSRILSDEHAIVLVGLSKKQKELIPSTIIGIDRTESIKELAELYSAADIILNLSNQETFGMTTVEGFSCGTPSIAYNCTANPELITPETGIIVEPGNIEQLVKAIETIKSNKKEYYSANCRKLAEMFYDKENKYNEYLQLYEKVLNNKFV